MTGAGIEPAARALKDLRRLEEYATICKFPKNCGVSVFMLLIEITLSIGDGHTLGHTHCSVRPARTVTRRTPYPTSAASLGRSMLRATHQPTPRRPARRDTVACVESPRPRASVRRFPWEGIESRTRVPGRLSSRATTRWCRRVVPAARYSQGAAAGRLVSLATTRSWRRLWPDARAPQRSRSSSNWCEGERRRKVRSWLRRANSVYSQACGSDDSSDSARRRRRAVAVPLWGFRTRCSDGPFMRAHAATPVHREGATALARDFGHTDPHGTRGAFGTGRFHLSSYPRKTAVHRPPASYVWTCVQRLVCQSVCQRSGRLPE